MKFNDLEKQHSLYGHIINDDLAAVQQYLRVKPDLASKVSLEGYQLIHVAAASGAALVIEWLLENKNLVSIRDEDNNPPLVHAIIHNQLAIVQLLVEKGASLETLCFAKHNAAFITACINNRFEILQWCINTLQNKHGEQFEETFSQELFMAAILASYKGRIKIVEYLISLRPSIVVDDLNGDSLLFCAACEGHESLTHNLIDKGAILTKINHLNETPLEATLKLNQTKTAEVILKAMVEQKLPLPMMKSSSAQQLLEDLKKNVKSPKKDIYVPEASLWSVSSSSGSSDSGSDDSLTFSL